MGKALTQALQKEQVAVTILMALIFPMAFYATDIYMSGQFLQGRSLWNPALKWDTLIPFVPEWIWIYLLYFPICFLPITFRELWMDIGIFRKTVAGFGFQFVVAMTFFWLLPSQMSRPSSEFSDLGRRVLGWFYTLDPGFNIFPSLHVANTSFISCLTWRIRGSLSGFLVWMICIFIAVSALFVKQHYLLDLPAGLFLGIFSYRLAFSGKVR